MPATRSWHHNIVLLLQLLKAGTFFDLRLNFLLNIVYLGCIVFNSFSVVLYETLGVLLFRHFLSVGDSLRCLQANQPFQYLCLVLEPINEFGIKVVMPVVQQVSHV